MANFESISLLTPSNKFLSLLQNLAKTYVLIGLHVSSPSQTRHPPLSRRLCGRHASPACPRGPAGGGGDSGVSSPLAGDHIAPSAWDFSTSRDTPQCQAHLSGFVGHPAYSPLLGHQVSAVTATFRDPAPARTPSPTPAGLPSRWVLVISLPHPGTQSPALRCCCYFVFVFFPRPKPRAHPHQLSFCGSLHLNNRE